MQPIVNSRQAGIRIWRFSSQRLSFVSAVLLAVWPWPVAQSAEVKTGPSGAPTPATTPDKAGEAKQRPDENDGWKPLFDGKSLSGWQVTDFAGHGEVRIEKNFKGAPALIIEQGGALSGVTLTNAVPKIDYEVSLEALKVAGSDFFCGLTVPYGDSHCTLVVGGWGGAVAGISSIDSNDASMNETTTFMRFDPDRWYRIRLRATARRLEAWIDGDRIIDVETTDKVITMRSGEIEASIPFGLATWQTTAALRDIKIRPVRTASAEKK